MRGSQVVDRGQSGVAEAVAHGLHRALDGLLRLRHVSHRLDDLVDARRLGDLVRRALDEVVLRVAQDLPGGTLEAVKQSHGSPSMSWFGPGTIPRTMLVRQRARHDATTRQVEASAW